MTPEEWRATWPQHCTTCKGWGGWTYPEYHGPGLIEDIFDLCDGRPESTCHRCNTAEAMNGEDPCSTCGWNYDDGAPAE